jgi:hypothetical protein
VLRFAERGPAVVHTLEIDVTVLRARSNNRGVDVERVDNIAASEVPTLRLTVTTGWSPCTRRDVLVHRSGGQDD